MAKGYDSPWTTWRCLNRLPTGYTGSKVQTKKWKYYTGDTMCACGKEEETRSNMHDAVFKTGTSLPFG